MTAVWGKSLVSVLVIQFRVSVYGVVPCVVLCWGKYREMASILEPVLGVSSAMAMWCWRCVGVWYGSILV